ncbi:MAG: hypothetical protein ACQEQL_08545 [Pseudomonadota bacterium]
MAIRKSKAPRPGREHMDMSKRIGKGGKVIDTAEEEKYAGRRSRGMPTLFVAVFAMAFAFLYSEYYVDSTALLNLFGDATVNKTFFGPGYPLLFGQPLLDQGVVTILRGLMFMAVFGLSPVLTYLSSRMLELGGGSFYFRNWIVLSLIAFIAALLHVLLIPLAIDVFAMFTLET